MCSRQLAPILVSIYLFLLFSSVYLLPCTHFNDLGSNLIWISPLWYQAFPSPATFLYTIDKWYLPLVALMITSFNVSSSSIQVSLNCMIYISCSLIVSHGVYKPHFHYTLVILEYLDWFHILTIVLSATMNHCVYMNEYFCTGLEV